MVIKLALRVIKNVVRGFSPLRHCEAGQVSRSNLGGAVVELRLPRPDESGLAMTKSKMPDKSGNYKNLEVKTINVAAGL
jgi:hypothetical protein